MNDLHYIVSGSGRISAVANGFAYTVDTDHPHYQDIKKCLKTGDASLFITLVDIPKTINDFGKGKIKIQNGIVYYGDKVINNSITNRILWMMREDFDVNPMITFLENLMLNPSSRAVNELYTWLEHQCIPITSDGCWIGYKYLNSTERTEYDPVGKDIYLDVHTGTIRQWLGKVIEVERNTVDDNWGVDCSHGLHVGSSKYQFSGNIKVLVKVNPRDVVTVPSQEADKCRVCRYEIVQIFKDVYNTPVVGVQGETVSPPRPEEKICICDEDHCDDCGRFYLDCHCDEE